MLVNKPIPKQMKRMHMFIEYEERNYFPKTIEQTNERQNLQCRKNAGT